jgi:hypothetical protein
MTVPDDQAKIEGAILGALVTGALGARDVADLADAFVFQLNREIWAVLTSLLEMRAVGARVPGRVGIDLAFAIRACERVCAGPVGGVWGHPDWRGRTRTAGYLPTLAREAPRRLEALAAVAELRERERRRWDVERDREAMTQALSEVLTEAAVAFVGYVSEEGAVALRGGLRRPIDPDAVLTPAEARRLVGEALAWRQDARAA